MQRTIQIDQTKKAEEKKDANSEKYFSITA